MKNKYEELEEEETMGREEADRTGWRGIQGKAGLFADIYNSRKYTESC